MKCFRYKEDRIPVLIFCTLFLCDLIVYFAFDSVPVLILWMLIGISTKMFIAAWNHHHQHVNTFYQTALNRLLEVVYAFHTGITTNLWVLHHNLGHHLHYRDQSLDESSWLRKDGTRMGPLEYALTIAATGYSRGFVVGREYPKFRTAFLIMTAVNCGLLGLLLWHRPLAATLVFIIPMVTSYFMTCLTTYYHHAGLDTEDHFCASHNITNKFYNLISGNLGYHTAHHMKQALHWSKLPEFHRSIESHIPPELIHSSFPFSPKFLAEHRRAEELRNAGCNRGALVEGHSNL